MVAVATDEALAHDTGPAVARARTVDAGRHAACGGDSAAPATRSVYWLTTSDSAVGFPGTDRRARALFGPLVGDQRFERCVVVGAGPEVRVSDLLVASDRLEVALDDDVALVEDRYAITDIGDDAHVVFDDGEGGAPFVECLEVVEQSVAQRRVHPRRGFVEQDDCGFEHQHATEFEQFLLPTGDAASVVVCDVVDLEQVEQFVGPVAFRGRNPQAGPQTAGEDCKQVLADGQIFERRRYLERAAEASAGDAVGRPTGQIFAVEPDSAHVWLVKSGDGVEKRRLS